MTTKTIQNIQQQLEAAQARVKQLKARQQALMAKQRAAESKKKRAEDTRRKILLGAFVLAKSEPEAIKKMMDGYLTEDRDRALFDLPPLNHDREAISQA